MTTPRECGIRAVWEQAPFVAIDTGCYAQPDAFNLGSYLGWLETLGEFQGKTLFATAPDRVGDWETTWQLAAPALPEIRARGFKVALVAQDGCAELPDPARWDVLFVGGSTDWKLREAPRLVRQAKAWGKWTHCGRVNSLRRLVHCQLVGYDSADGTCLKRNPPYYLVTIGTWLDHLNRQPALGL